MDNRAERKRSRGGLWSLRTWFWLFGVTVVFSSCSTFCICLVLSHSLVMALTLLLNIQSDHFISFELDRYSPHCPFVCYHKIFIGTSSAVCLNLCSRFPLPHLMVRYVFLFCIALATNFIKLHWILMTWQIF